MENASLKPVAFYLPQFHPIPENDEWWGKGFTEWTNVTRASPLFEGHRQPRLPTETGFYDLRVPEVRLHQEELASDHGIHGFCYYFYWFNGRRVLERPLQDKFSDQGADLPFCLFWANERWTRTWSFKGQDVLMEQTYSSEDAEALIQHLIPMFRDPRYIKVDGKPVFVVYHPIQINIWNTYEHVFRQRVAEAGFPGLYLCMVLKSKRQSNHQDFNCDAMIEFPPSMAPGMKRMREVAEERYGDRFFEPHEGRLMLHRRLMQGFIKRKYEGQTVHRTVVTDFDNTARMGKQAMILPDAAPEVYGKWLRQACADTMERHQGDARLVFIFAWNEWAEGAYLEPDEHHGRAYLEMTRYTLKAFT